LKNSERTWAGLYGNIFPPNPENQVLYGIGSA